jgi:tRNA(adenine34) deaminase
MAARDTHFMHLALALARQAALTGDVPVGALVVLQGQVIGWGYNQRQAAQDPLGHAELLALQMACKALGTWRLPSQNTLYVTLEPCPMCAGALTQARVERLVFACRDPKAGAIRSLYALGDDPRLPHRLQVHEGVCAPEAQHLLQSFFSSLRAPTP